MVVLPRVRDSGRAGGGLQAGPSGESGGRESRGFLGTRVGKDFYLLGWRREQAGPASLQVPLVSWYADDVLFRTIRL